MKQQIMHANIVLADAILEDGVCCFENGNICYVGKTPQPDAETVLDAAGSWLLPGFIDIHCHGAAGKDFRNCTAEEMLEIARFHLHHGTTTLLATTTTGSWESIYRALDRYASLEDKLNMTGIHMEGPWFNPAQCGAQDVNTMDMHPSAAHLRELKARYPFITRISAAPELPGGHEFGEAGRELGIVMSMGHPDATFAQTLKAAEHGYSLMTHLYSGMRGTVRENCFRVAGAVEGGLYDDRLDVEIIADGRHLPVELLRYICKVKGFDQVCLITDAIRAAGLPEGTVFNDGTHDAIVEDQVGKIMDRSCFVGSVATTDRLIRVMHLEAGFPLVKVSHMMSAVPARIMGYADRGAIEAGKRADLVVLDENFETTHVFLNGTRQ